MKTKFMSILVLCLLLMCSVAFAEYTVDDANKTIAVSGGGSAIQEAIKYITANTDKKDWTINVSAGDYSRFMVKKGMDGLTINGGEGVNVAVLVKDTMSFSYEFETYGVGVFAEDVTLDGLTFNYGTDSRGWYDCAVMPHYTVNGLTVSNCTFNGQRDASGAPKANGMFMNSGNHTWTVTGCTFNDLNQGIYGEASTNYQDVLISGNTFDGCSFSFHGSYGGKGTGSGDFVVTNNKFIGTADLRNKFILQDTNDNDATTLTFTGNDNNNAIVGVVNLQGDVAGDILSENSFPGNSHYVEAIEPGTIEFYTTFKVPANKNGYWTLNDPSDVGNPTYNPDGSLEYIQNAIAQANKSGDHTLSITGIDEDNLIRTFTWFKDAIYWVDLPATGDGADLMLWGAMVAFAAVALVALNKKRAMSR